MLFYLLKTYTSAFKNAGIGIAYASVFKSTSIGCIHIFVNTLYSIGGGYKTVGIDRPILALFYYY